MGGGKTNVCASMENEIFLQIIEALLSYLIDGVYHFILGFFRRLNAFGVYTLE